LISFDGGVYTQGTLLLAPVGHPSLTSPYQFIAFRRVLVTATSRLEQLLQIGLPTQVGMYACSGDAGIYVSFDEINETLSSDSAHYLAVNGLGRCAVEVSAIDRDAGRLTGRIEASLECTTKDGGIELHGFFETR
jgi:hypothetical protein